MKKNGGIKTSEKDGLTDTEETSEYVEEKYGAFSRLARGEEDKGTDYWNQGSTERSDYEDDGEEMMARCI